MADFLKRYYEAIHSQLAAEVEYINEIFAGWDHQDLKGEGNESALRELIRRFIPKRYAVGTGILVDSDGTPSKQCDIVIYDDTQYPSIFSLSSLHIYPVDLVYAIIEIKSTLDSAKAKVARENIQAAKRLNFIQHRFPIYKGNSISAVDTSPPLGIIFAYQSLTPNFATFKEWFSPSEHAPLTDLPDLVGCLDQGLLINKGELNSFVDPNIHPSLVGKKPIGMACQFTQKVTGDGESVSISCPDEKPYIDPGTGRVYRQKKVRDVNLAIDPAKSLLHFLVTLSDLLSTKHIHPELQFRDTYIKDTMGRVLFV